MPDIACKAILRFPSLRFFSFFCWMFAKLAWAFTFLKVFTSPAPGVRHFSPPRDFRARSSRGEGARALCSPKTTLPWEFPAAISHGRAPSSGWKHRRPPLHALPEPETRAWKGAPGALPHPGGRQPRSPGSPSSGPAAESPDVGFTPYAGSFISIKGQRLGGAEIAAAAGAPASPAELASPPRATPPQPGSSRGPGPESGGGGRRGRGEAAGPAEGGSAGRGGGSWSGTEGAGREGWSAEGEARGSDGRTPLVARAGTPRFAGRGEDPTPPPLPGEPRSAPVAAPARARSARSAR